MMKNVFSLAAMGGRKHFLWLILLAFFVPDIHAEQKDPALDSLVMEIGQPQDEDAFFEDLVKAYGGDDNEEFKELHRQFDEYEQRAAAAEAKRTMNRWMVLFLSLLIALFPSLIILKRVMTGELVLEDKAVVWGMVGRLLFYAIVSFALNYAWLWCMFTGQTVIMRLVLGLGLFAFVIYAIHTLRKSKKNNENTNSPTP